MPAPKRQMALGVCSGDIDPVSVLAPALRVAIRGREDHDDERTGLDRPAGDFDLAQRDAP